MPAYRDNRTGRWRYRVWCTLPNGNRERLTGTPATDTKAAAEHAERLHVFRVMNPGLVPAEPDQDSKRKERVPTLRHYATDFQAGYLPDSKPSERKSKRQILDGHLVPFFGHLRLDEIRQSDVDAFVTQELKRVGRKTINNRLAVLSSLLKYAHENKLIPKPTLRLNLKRKGAAKDAPIVAVDPDDIAKLISAATDDRYRLALLLTSEAGLRIGEVLGLQWTDIKHGELTVRRAVDPDGNIGLPKHDRMRDVPLSPALADEIARAPRRGLWVMPRLDGAMLTYSAAIEGIREIYKRAEVTIPVSESGVRRPWHSLRHSFGTTCASRGMPITTLQELMGHEDVETTRRYVSVTKVHKHDGMALVFGTERQPVGNRSGERASSTQSSTRK